MRITGINYSNIKYNPIKRQNFNNNFEKPFISFEAQCSRSGFKIKELKGLRCPVCGQAMITKEEFEEIANEISSKKGEELINAIRKYENEENFFLNPKSKNKGLFRPREQQALDIIKMEARKYPNKSLLELVKQKGKNNEVTYTCSLARKTMKELRYFIEFKFNNPENYAKAKKVIEKYNEDLLGKNKYSAFDKEKFTKEMMDTTGNLLLQEDLRKIIRKLPFYNKNAIALIAKWGKNCKTSKEVIENAINPSRSSTDHLQTLYANGKNDTANYMCDCWDCNVQRGDTSFRNWQKTIPDFEQNLQKYIETIQKAIDNNELDSKYDNYVKEFIKTIDELSEGKIKLKHPKENYFSKIKREISSFLSKGENKKC